MNKPTIMLAVDDKENRRLLQEWLEQYYTVVIRGDSAGIAGAFDLGIFDGVTLNRIGERTQIRKDNGQVGYLPVLLVTTRQDVRMATRQLGHVVDEIIFMPIEKIELLARVEALLRARQFSLDLAGRNLELHQEIIAHQATEKALHASEARTRLLQTLTADLATAITPQDVLNLMEQRVVSALGGSLGVIAVVAANADCLEILTEKAAREADQLPPRRLDLGSDLPLTRVARTGQPLWCESSSDCDTLFAEHHAVLNQATARSAVVLPLIVSGKTTGAMSIFFMEARQFSGDDRDFFLALTQQCAQALERARLYQDARQQGISDERERLARELHDDVNQSLFMINMLGQSIPRMWEKKPERARELLDRIVHMTKSATSEMRLLLLEMRPEHLMQASLKDLYAHLVTKTLGRRLMELTCTVEYTSPLPAEVHLTFYRIVQECLNNIVKHSRATVASISLAVEDDRLVLRVRDNGRGFDLASQDPGMGLRIIRERADIIGASMDILSTIDQGTEIILALDLARV